MVPSGSEALDPGQLRISSGPGSFYCNGICSVGFALEHQIKSASGVGVNGEVWHLLTLSQSPWRPMDQKASISSIPLSLGMAASKQRGQDPTEERLEVGAVTPH